MITFKFVPQPVKLMQTIHTVAELQAVVVCFLVSVCASFSRVLLYKSSTFRDMILTFIGGIFVGTLVGFLISQWPKYSSLDKLFAAWAAIVGKEFVNFVIIQAPALLKLLWEKLLTIKIGSK